MSKLHKMLEVTISGTYHNSKKEILDFDEVVGKIPFVDDDHAKMHVRRRYASRWIKEALDKDDKKKYPQRVEHIRTVYCDDLKECEGELSFIGKDIKRMSFEELQDLATAKDIRYIPVTKDDIRVARMRAYAAYSEKVLKKEVKWQDEGFADNFMKMPAIIVPDAEAMEVEKKISNDEVIESEMASKSTSDDPQKRFTLPELKQLADSKNIPYAPNIGFDALYKKLYT